MKTQLIMLPQPILVSDEQGSLGYNYNFGLQKIDNLPKHYPKFTTEWQFCKKIIAGIPDLPSIDFSALSAEACKKIGWVDTWQQAKWAFEREEERIPNLNNSKDLLVVAAIEVGFKAAQALNEKKFSEAQVIEWYEAMRHQDWKEPSEYFSQSKIFNVEVEMEDEIKAYHKRGLSKIHPKITNNAIKITKIL